MYLVTYTAAGVQYSVSFSSLGAAELATERLRAHGRTVSLTHCPDTSAVMPLERSVPPCGPANGPKGDRD